MHIIIPRRFGLPPLDLGDYPTLSAALTGAVLRRADLTRADLRRAALTGADLTGAALTGAALTGAALTGAALTGAALTGADLRRADLTGADLRRAALTRAALTGADLTEADLTGADLTRAVLTGADLTEADLTGAIGLPAAPVVPAIDAAILAEIEAGGTLAMGRYHSCATTHCRAGWAIHRAGEAGYALERQVGPYLAGALIYAASRPGQRVPNFYATNAAALADLRACAAAQGED